MLKNFRNTKGFTLIELMIVVAIIAILAVVAVPQFTKYMRSAKAAEANEMLDLIKKGSATYYTTPRVQQGTGAKVECQFPADVDTTPTGSSCCASQNDSDADGRCDAKPGNWNSTSWSALKFAITDQHYFQYRYQSTGSKGTAVFTANSHADLDCDGQLSTFQIVGKGDPASTNSECDMQGTSAIFRDNETE